MDIHIFHDGEQRGPYTEEAVHALLKEGSVQVNDPAWRPGMPEWMPLLDLLHPAATPSAPPTPVALNITAQPLREPATQRQQAFLAYLRIPFTPEITREEASSLVNDALENPRDPARLARWNEERLQLHPELFASEAQARKENRPQRYLAICQEEGSLYFEKVTKAHCQVLVGHLDVRFPKWDAFEREAVQKYFFPALAEKFPQLVTAEGKQKFPLPTRTPVVRKTARQVPVVAQARTLAPAAPTIFSASFRGVMLGLVILGALWGGREMVTQKKAPPRGTPMAKAKETPERNAPAATTTGTPAESATSPQNAVPTAAAPAMEAGATEIKTGSDEGAAPTATAGPEL